MVSLAFFNVPTILGAIWLGRLSTEALAASGIGMALRLTLISPLMALSSASGAVVARYVGAKDQERANAAVLQGVILFIAVSLIIALIALAFLRPLLRLAGAVDDGVLPLALQYTRVLMIGLVALEAVPSIGFMLVAAGSPELSMRVNLLVSGTRSLLEPFLILGLGAFSGYGIIGASLALVIANTLGMGYALYLLVTRQASAYIDLAALRLDWAIMKRIVTLALPSVIQRGVPNLAQNVLLRLISPFGAAALAAYNVLRNVFNVALTPCLGVARSAGALVGQNLGAEKPKRAARSVTYIGRIVIAVGIVIIALVLAFRPTILGWFTDDTEAIAGLEMAAILGGGILLYTIGLCYDYGLTGAGDTVSPMVINVIVLWGVQVPAIWLLSQRLGWGASGVWWGIACSQLVYAILLCARFGQGKWKQIKL